MKVGGSVIYGEKYTVVAWGVGVPKGITFSKGTIDLLPSEFGKDDQ